MPLRVDQLSLGPIGTNCYVVRADDVGRRGGRRRPERRRRRAPADARAPGARCTAILVTHGHWDHLVGVADLAEGTGAPVYMAEGERMLLEEPGDFTPPGVVLRPYVAGRAARRRGDARRSRASPSTCSPFPGTRPRHLAYHADGCLFSGDVLFAGSVGRTDFPGADWETLSRRSACCSTRFPPETIVYPGHGPTTTLGAELARNPFLAELRAERAG